jgi:urease accessory protein
LRQYLFSIFNNGKTRFSLAQLSLKQVSIFFFALFILISFVTPAHGHHPLGGQTPANFMEGLLSGFGHPIIGLDHFLGVIAIGLIAIANPLGIFFPISFILATLLGAVIHLFGWNLPFAEIVIALSVIIFGLILNLKHLKKIKVNNPFLQNFGLILLIAIAGIFHGYAYGESIIGAEMTPLFAYLTGFTLIQLLISITSYKIGNLIFQQFHNQFLKVIPLIGLGISTAGVVFILS